MTKDSADAVTAQPDDSCSLRADPRPKTLSVPVAGRRYFDLGKNASYGAAKRGEFPVLRIGRRLRVSVAALEQMLAATFKRDND